MKWVHTMYLTDISNFRYFKGALAAISFGGAIIVLGDYLQRSSNLKCTVFL